MEDETQRHEPVGGKPPPQPAPRPTPARPSPSPSDSQLAPQARQPARTTEPAKAGGVATPRGLENLRTDPPPAQGVDLRPSPGVEPRSTPPPAPTTEARPYLPSDPRGASTIADAPPFAPDFHEPMYLPVALSVGAGFKFGCGLMLAFAVSTLGLFLVLSVLFFIASLAQVPFPGLP